MKKVVIVFLLEILVSIPVTGFYMLNYGNPIHKPIANKYVPEYLKIHGYTDDQIMESHYVEPKHLINKDYYHGHFMVRFADEPGMTYYYGVSRNGKEVKQFCERDFQGSTGGEHIDYYDKRSDSKHLEQGCVYSLANRD